MMTVVNSREFVAGIPERPDRPFLKPEGVRRYRIRFRNKDFARVFLVTADGISERMLLDKGDHFEAADEETEQGRNIRK